MRSGSCGSGCAPCDAESRALYYEGLPSYHMALTGYFVIASSGVSRTIPPTIA